MGGEEMRGWRRGAMGGEVGGETRREMEATVAGAGGETVDVERRV